MLKESNETRNMIRNLDLKINVLVALGTTVTIVYLYKKWKSRKSETGRPVVDDSQTNSNIPIAVPNASLPDIVR
jgi:predicted transporter